MITLQDGGEKYWAHSSGRSCNISKYGQPSGDFKDVISYSIPNSICKKCGSPVFLFSDRKLRRAKFSMGKWPWAPHRCLSSESTKKPTRNRIFPTKFIDHHGRKLAIFVITFVSKIDGKEDSIYLELRSVSKNTKLKLIIGDLHDEQIGYFCEEFCSAPSVIIRRMEDGKFDLSFASASRGEIVAFVAENFSNLR